MEEKKDIALVAVVHWQYECCGKNFHIGDYICWKAEPYIKGDYIDINEKIREKINYSYEDCYGANGEIVGQVTKITKLKKDENGICKEVEDFTSAKLLSESSSYDYMLVTLKDTTYIRNSNEPSNSYFKKISVAGKMNELNLELLKKLKIFNFDINIVNPIDKKLNKAFKEVSKVRGFSHVEGYYSDLENAKGYDQFLNINFGRIMIIIDNKKICENLINIFGISKKYNIFFVDTKKHIIENYVNAGMSIITNEGEKMLSNVAIKLISENLYKFICKEKEDYINKISIKKMNNEEIAELLVEEINKYLKEEFNENSSNNR